MCDSSAADLLESRDFVAQHLYLFVLVNTILVPLDR